MLVCVGDSHSAYDREAALVGLVDRLHTAHPGVPLAVLLDGDVFEYGNRVARRTQGAIDFKWLRALAERAPTVLNLGNHESDLFTLTELVGRLRDAGVQVVSGNARDRQSGAPFAPARLEIALGSHRLTIVGIATDALATYRADVRPTVDLADPVTWADRHLAADLRDAEIPVVLSHAGLRADRMLWRDLPRGTLLVGGHDHLQLVHAADGITYVHTGHWLTSATVARAWLSPGAEARWTVEQIDLATVTPAPNLEREIHAAVERALTADDRRVVGHLDRALDPDEAAHFAVDAARRAVGADVAIIGATTFGGGLPRGDVTAYALDNCVRFDGPLYTARMNGAALAVLLQRTNPGPDTPYAKRTGEALLASTVRPVIATATYLVATTDWIGRNPAKYFGAGSPAFHEAAGTSLKAAVRRLLQDRASERPAP